MEIYLKRVKVPSTGVIPLTVLRIHLIFGSTLTGGITFLHAMDFDNFVFQANRMYTQLQTITQQDISPVTTTGTFTDKITVSHWIANNPEIEKKRYLFPISDASAFNMTCDDMMLWIEVAATLDHISKESEKFENPDTSHFMDHISTLYRYATAHSLFKLFKAKIEQQCTHCIISAVNPKFSITTCNHIQYNGSKSWVSMIGNTKAFHRYVQALFTESCVLLDIDPKLVPKETVDSVFNNSTTIKALTLFLGYGKVGNDSIILYGKMFDYLCKTKHSIFSLGIPNPGSLILLKKTFESPSKKQKLSE
jgi:hypothetical protein